MAKKKRPSNNRAKAEEQAVIESIEPPEFTSEVLWERTHGTNAGGVPGSQTASRRVRSGRVHVANEGLSSSQRHDVEKPNKK